MWSPTHVQVTVQRARGLLTKGKHKTNDCFVTIALGKEKYQTSVKEKANENVEWHEECELQIPSQGNTAEIVLTALHRNFLGVDEFLGMVSVPLSSFDVYERPRNRWYSLGSKPGKENTKERGELEVKIGFIVKAGSLTDLTRKERHKSSLGQLSTAAQSIGGSLLSIGSLEKRKGLKKLAKSIGNRVKGKSKSKLGHDHDFDEVEEHHIRPTRQEPGEADPGVISEDDDEFTFDDLSHKSSASSLNAPVSSGLTSGYSSNSTTQSSRTTDFSVSSAPTNPAPNKPPRFTSGSNLNSPLPTNNISGINNNTHNNNNSCNNNNNNNINNTNNNDDDDAEQDEWGRKLYGLQSSNINTKKWDNKLNPKIVVDQAKDNNNHALTSSINSSPSITTRFRDTPEPPSPAPREIIQVKRTNKDDKTILKDRNSKEEKQLITGNSGGRDRSPNVREDKAGNKSQKDEKISKKDKKNREKELLKNKDIGEEVKLSSERIIIGGEDATKKNNMGVKSRLPHEVLAQFDGKTREDLIELALQLQTEVNDKKRRLSDLEDYIDSLLLRVIETSPRILQNPYSTNHRLL
ncbi:rab11 family-interacting protein 2 [Microplitis demolitor]|uniref:rab11 family-interacting protein 2 n=1 Tax=Microplitis demolitor TaxID=69319 RepID=UPI0004CCFC01|nr:rab11 family-interacting protein 2 [Microplitis demolitor]